MNALLLLRLVAHALSDSSSQTSGQCPDLVASKRLSCVVPVSFADRWQCRVTVWNSFTAAPAAQVGWHSFSFVRRRSRLQLTSATNTPPPLQAAALSCSSCSYTLPASSSCQSPTQRTCWLPRPRSATARALRSFPACCALPHRTAGAAAVAAAALRARRLAGRPQLRARSAHVARCKTTMDLLMRNQHRAASTAAPAVT